MKTFTKRIKQKHYKRDNKNKMKEQNPKQPKKKKEMLGLPSNKKDGTLSTTLTQALNN